jgi:hypothetical protein
MKTEVYSWRVSPEVKAALEREARREKTSLAALLDRVARQWLEERKSRSADDAAEQARLHAAAEKCIGTIARGPDFAESASKLIRESLARKYGR